MMEVAGMSAVERLAPTGDAVVEYDRRHLALYAELLDAADAGVDWQDTAAAVLRLDVTQADAEACWRSHLDRARWIVGAGLAPALVYFNESAVRE
jgi:hypothetical protein